MKQIFFAIITLLLTIESKSQNFKSFNKADTILLKKYYDTISICPLYSQKRQRYLDSILIIDHENSYLWQQKAMPLFKLKKYEFGSPYLDSAVKYDKTLHWQEYRGFMKCIFQKNYNDAIKDLQFVKIKNENGIIMDHSFNFYIGLSYLQINNFDSSNFYIRKSLDYGEKKWGNGHFLEYLYLGIVKMETEDYENAIINFDKALNIYPRFSDAKYYKATCLKNQRKLNEAIDLYKECLEDLKKGLTINEDNVFYEDYPYQIKTHNVKTIIKIMTEK